VSITLDSIQTLPSAHSANQRRDAAARLEGANERAARRHALASFAARLEGSVEDRLVVIRAAVEADILKGHVPARETLRMLVHRFHQGHVSAADFRDDRNKRGRKERQFAEGHLAVIRTTAGKFGLSNIEQLTVEVNRAAMRQGYPELTRYYVVKALRLIGLERLTAARQGSRAAILDAMSRGTYPVKHTHDAWGLDEGDPRIWTRVFCRGCGEWVSAREPVVVTKDHASSAYLRLQVADVARRINDVTLCCETTGFDRDDVLACLLSAACRELAASGYEELAGALPKLLRWDNASAHKALFTDILEPMLLALAEGLDDPDADESASAEVLPPPDIAFIPKRRPDRNGSVERSMATLKEWSIAAKGHVDLVIPEDQFTGGITLGHHRALVTSAGTDRQSRLKVVPVASLPTHEELQEVLNELGLRYNREHRVRRHGMTPLFAARKYAAKHTRAGIDLVRALPVAAHKVQREGIVVQRDGVRVAYEAVNNGVQLQVGALAQVYVDPLQRVLWLEQGRGVVVLKAKTEAAAEQDPREFAAAMQERARRASDEADADRDRDLDETYGPGTAEAGKAAYERALDAQAQGRTAGPRRGGNGSHGSKSARAKTPEVAPTSRRAAPRRTTTAGSEDVAPEPLSSTSALPEFDPERMLRDLPDDEL
jgi:hypothetical protein